MIRRKGDGWWRKSKKKINQPIKYVVLTHYHGDHSWGLMGFPQNVTAISHTHCAENFANNCEPELKETVEKWLPQQIRELQQKLIQLKKENNPGTKKEEDHLSKLKQRLEDLKKGQLVYPTITFTDKLTLRMGKETIELIYPGRAHTNGNVLVYMPDRKVMVMGDMLFYGYLPYIDWRAGSDTQNWIAWLEKLSPWQIDTVIPGHGEVAGKVAFKQQEQYLADLRQRVKEAMTQGLSLEEMTKSINMTGYKDLKFFDFLASNIEAVYHEMKE